MKRILLDNHQQYYKFIRIPIIAISFFFSFSSAAQVLKSRTYMLSVRGSQDSIIDYRKTQASNALILHNVVKKELSIYYQDSTKNQTFNLVRTLGKETKNDKSFKYTLTEMMVDQKGKKGIGIIYLDDEGIVGLTLNYDDSTFIYLAVPIKEKSTNDFFVSGNTKKNQGDYQGAILEYTKAINFNPNDADAYTNRGFAKNKLRDYKGAILDFSKAIELNPSEAKSYFNRGSAKANSEDYQGAIADFSKAIEINPNFAESYHYRGNLKYTLNDYRGAIVDNSKAIEIISNYEDAYITRANARLEIQEFKEAISDFSAALNINPKNSETYYRRGLAKIAIAQKDSGCLDLSKAGELGYLDAYDAIKKYCN